MRKAKSFAKTTKVKRHTIAERIALRKIKRRTGPSALRRKARRAELQPKGGDNGQ